MTLLIQRKTATLKTNVNLKTTADTRHDLGNATMVSNDQEARTLGIPGTSGQDGIDGIDGAQALNWQGEFEWVGAYTLNDLVNFNGTTFIYISETDGIQEIPSQNTTTWQVFTGNPEMRVEIDELPDGDFYVGKSLPESGLWEAKWSIKLVKFVNEDISVVWADSVSTYTKVWNDRTTYIYS